MSHFYRYFWTCVCLSMVFEVASSVETDVRWLIWGAARRHTALSAATVKLSLRASPPETARHALLNENLPRPLGILSCVQHKERSHQDVDHTFFRSSNCHSSRLARLGLAGDTPDAGRRVIWRKNSTPTHWQTINLSQRSIFGSTMSHYRCHQPWAPGGH